MINKLSCDINMQFKPISRQSQYLQIINIYPEKILSQLCGNILFNSIVKIVPSFSLLTKLTLPFK